MQNAAHQNFNNIIFGINRFILDGFPVALTRELQDFVDKELVALADLTQILQSKAGGTREPGVLVFADRALPYQMIYNVLDKIRQAGLSRISLQADFEE